MASHEMLLSIEESDDNSSPVVQITFAKDDKEVFWARVGSSAEDDQFDEVLDSEEAGPDFALDEDTLCGLATLFVKGIS